MWSNRKTCSGTENGGGEETHRGNAVLEKNKPAAESKHHLLSSGKIFRLYIKSMTKFCKKIKKIILKNPNGT